MNRLINRIAAADGLVSRAVDRLARKVLPTVTAAGSCYYRCTGVTCYSTFYSSPGRQRCMYCTAGYWTGDCFCSPACL
ncbi:MAG TPA: hypothetical protein VKZ74_07675 [Natronosporangium sp.]|nr:hypothetical protein [Natronosporangium sp.]